MLAASQAAAAVDEVVHVTPQVFAMGSVHSVAAKQIETQIDLEETSPISSPAHGVDKAASLPSSPGRHRPSQLSSTPSACVPANDDDDDDDDDDEPPTQLDSGATHIPSDYQDGVGTVADTLAAEETEHPVAVASWPGTATAVEPSSGHDDDVLRMKNGVYSKPSLFSDAASKISEKVADNTAYLRYKQTITVHVDGGGSDLVPLLNRAQAATKEELSATPAWLVEQYRHRAITMDLSQGYIVDLSNLGTFSVLVTLIMDHNLLASLQTLPPLQSLAALSLEHNQISDLAGTLEILQKRVPRLAKLSLKGNPCCTQAGDAARMPTSGANMYRLDVSVALTSLKELDGAPAREGFHALWTLPMRVWNEHLLPYLGLKDVVALGGTCGYARNIAQHMQPQGFLCMPASAGLDIRAATMKAWPNVQFTHEYATVADFDEDVSANLPLSELVFNGVDELTTTAGIVESISANSITPQWVRFAQCENLAEATAFKAATKVAFDGCKSLVSVADLAHSASVSFANCPQVKMIDVMYNLASVQEVTLDGCPSLTTIGELGGKGSFYGTTTTGREKEWKRHKLALHNCNGIKRLQGLETVHTIELVACTAISSLAGLTGVHTVAIDGCSKIRDVSRLTGCHSITIANLPLLRSFSASGSAASVAITDCDGMTTISNFSGTSSVHVENCASLSNVKNFGNAGDVRFINCAGLVSMEGLGMCHSVTIDSCGDIADLSPLATCTRVHLRHVSINNINCLESCPEVIVEDCKYKGAKLNTTILYSVDINAQHAVKQPTEAPSPPQRVDTTPTPKPMRPVSAARQLTMQAPTAASVAADCADFMAMAEKKMTASSPSPSKGKSSGGGWFRGVFGSNAERDSREGRSTKHGATDLGSLDDLHESEIQDHQPISPGRLNKHKNKTHASAAKSSKPEKTTHEKQIAHAAKSNTPWKEGSGTSGTSGKAKGTLRRSKIPVQGSKIPVQGPVKAKVDTGRVKRQGSSGKGKSKTHTTKSTSALSFISPLKNTAIHKGPNPSKGPSPSDPKPKENVKSQE